METPIALTSAQQTVITVPLIRSREGATRDLASRHLQGVSVLLSTREDLRGVHAFADVVEESVRWCA